MNIEVDLHLHSHHSDGVHSPSEVVAKAAEAGLRAMALTDHDTLSGVAEAMSAAPDGLEVVAGVELSSVYKGHDIHLLAYDLDPGDQALHDFLEPLRKQRRTRAARMVERLSKLGLRISMEEVEEIAGEAGRGAGGSLGRPHVAEAIVRAGAAADMDQAFVRYLRRGMPGFVAKASVSFDQALDFVRQRGAALVLAHPALNLSMKQVETLAREGLDGLEVWHPKHREAERATLSTIAKSTGIVESGGSDYHGPGRSKQPFACTGTTMEALARLRESGRRNRKG